SRDHPDPGVGHRLPPRPGPRGMLRPQLRGRPRLRGDCRVRRHFPAGHHRRRRARGPDPRARVRPRAVGAPRPVRPLPATADPSWPEDLLAPSYGLWLGSVLPAVAVSLAAEPASLAAEPAGSTPGREARA